MTTPESGLLPDWTPMNFDAMRHYLRGGLMRWLRRPTAAITAYRLALAADPGLVKAARIAAFLLAARHDYRGAEDLLQRAVDRVPSDAATWFNLGYVREQAGRRRDAIAAFRRAVELRPSLDQAWYGLGLAHAALGEHEAAAAALEQAARLQPMHGQAWYALGMAHHHCHHPERVREVIEHIVRYDPLIARRLIQETERADLAHLVAHLDGFAG